MQERIQAYLDISLTMTCGATICLGSYAALMTVIVIIVSSLYHNTGNCPICSEGTTDCRTQIQNHLDILSVDASSNDLGKQENGTCNCNTMNWLGFEIFELIVLTLIGIGILFIGFRCSTESKTWYQKWKQSRSDAKQKKFEKWKAQMESTAPATTSTKGRGSVHGNKSFSEIRTFEHGLKKPKREFIEPSLASYEPGSDEEQA
jgi:hypothetical protein